MGIWLLSKTEGIALHFVGNNKEEIYDFAFSTAKEPYSMTIKLSNINVKTELAQYGYDGKEVSYEGGLLNMDLTIASSGMSGWIAFWWSRCKIYWFRWYYKRSKGKSRV